MEKYNPAGLEGWDVFWQTMNEERKKEFDNLLKSLADESGKAYESTVADFQTALNQHAEHIREITALELGDRAPEIESLADSVTEWLKQRDQRWSGLGLKLGTVVRKGIKGAIGI